MSELGFRQQVLTTLGLIPITFGLWYAAGALLVGPAAWVAQQILVWGLSDIVAGAELRDTLWLVITQYGDVGGKIVPASQAEYEIALQFNTRLVSYSIPFYASLLWGSRVDNAVGRFAIGLFALWLLMALGLVAIAAKDMMLVLGEVFLNAPGVPPTPAIAIAYQFSVLVVPSLAPVAVWVWQLRGTPLWLQVAAQLERAARSNA